MREDKWFTYWFLTLPDEKKLKFVAMIVWLIPELLDAIPQSVYARSLEHILANKIAKDYLERYIENNTHMEKK